ncbi:hypothetical protein OHD62_23810 [Mesorhizobium sp. YC-39]|nr:MULTISPECIES: hypothetical protein [unclassified Mesorhizobium]MCV3209239.1 hypothetical protein [Mesorhizobium sp. YC-2]MCV3231411.1 hypothetical protein [Mesorhizobium sp. YC-39]
MLDMFDHMNGKPEIEGFVGVRDVVAVEDVEAVQVGDLSCLDRFNPTGRNLDRSKGFPRPFLFSLSNTAPSPAPMSRTFSNLSPSMIASM